MRRHQRYDAEQIVRDSGRAAGDEPLFGPVLNIKVFDYQLDILMFRRKPIPRYRSG